MRFPVPQRLHKKTGLDKYKFLVHCPRATSVEHIIINEKIERIPPSIYCIINEDEAQKRILLDKNKFIHLYDAISAVASLAPFTPYVRRYMTLYKSYEGISREIPIEFKAIRHAISHSSHALSNSKTIQTLEKLFGSKYINFNKKKHIDIFYNYFAKMLIYKKLITNLNSFRMLKNDEKVYK